MSGNCLVPDIATCTVLLMKTCDEVKALHLTIQCSIYKSFLALRSNCYDIYIYIYTHTHTHINDNVPIV